MIYDVLDVCRHIINYSEKEDYGVSNLKLQKLLYFVQAYFMLEKKDHAPCFHEKSKHGISDLLFLKHIRNGLNMAVVIFQ